MSADASERQPLLPPTALVSDQEIQDGENLVKDDVPPKKKSWWGIAGYIALAVVVIFFTALFIKGFIDADDVNVSPATNHDTTTDC